VLDYLWAPAESIESGGDGPTPTVCPDVPTLYTVDILNTDYGCMTEDSVFVNVSWFDPDFLEIFVDPDTIYANNNEFFEISTNQSEDLEYMWEGEGIVDPALPVIMASPTEEGVYMYSVTVTNPDGCQLTGQTSSGLTVLDPACDMSDVFIPSGFSPNDDGANDELRVYSNFIIDMELIIYNRWGQEVFRTTDQDVPWDGTYDGERLPPDVYGYYLRVTCPPNKEYMTQGNITLVR
jgi:gliding motility-associated-like protein